MLLFALAIGISSYVIFILGILGLFYGIIIKAVSIVFFIITIFYLFYSYTSMTFVKEKNILEITIIFLLIATAIVTLIGTLGPETSFDALWYHLTLPKIYLQIHKVTYIPGGLLYYSAMPQLVEMLYAAGLSLGSEIYAKFFHFLFGFLTCIITYNIARKFLNRRFALFSVLILTTNLVFVWEATTAYIDLARTFFEASSFYALIIWMERGEKKLFAYSAILMGFAISTKYLAIGTLIMMLIIISVKNHEKKKNILILNTLYLILATIPVIPWLIYSYIHTGNPVFPFFSKTYPIGLPFYLLNPLFFINDLWKLFTHAADPVSPVYFGVLPLVVILACPESLRSFYFFKKNKNIINNLQYLYLYSLLSILIWYFTPRTGGGRFILPYLPVYSILASYALSHAQKKIKSLLIGFVIIISIINLAYRTIANSRYIPVILGKQTKAQFFTKNLNFSFGDFYDIDGYFSKNIKKSDKVLLIGFHNLYYVNFLFVDNSWLTGNDRYNYIAVQKGILSSSFTDWKEIYYNPITNVRLYKK